MLMMLLFNPLTSKPARIVDDDVTKKSMFGSIKINLYFCEQRKSCIAGIKYSKKYWKTFGGIEIIL